VQRSGGGLAHVTFQYAPRITEKNHVKHKSGQLVSGPSFKPGTCSRCNWVDHTVLNCADSPLTFNRLIGERPTARTCKSNAQHCKAAHDRLWQQTTQHNTKSKRRRQFAHRSCWGRRPTGLAYLQGSGSTNWPFETSCSSLRDSASHSRRSEYLYTCTFQHTLCTTPEAITSQNCESRNSEIHRDGVHCANVWRTAQHVYWTPDRCSFVPQKEFWRRLMLALGEAH